MWHLCAETCFGLERLVFSIIFSFQSVVSFCYQPSFPTRRSSDLRAILPPPKKISCRIHSTNCAWLTLKLPTRWLARPRRRARIPPKDEGHADRPGQRHVHGRAHHWLRLRRVPFIRSARSPHSTFSSG